MGYPQKIVTCCYCGTRAVLVLRGETRHELTCASCGAPLHDLKMLPKRDRRRDVPDRPAPVPGRPGKPRTRKKFHKRRRGLLGKILKEAFDIAEDLLD